MWLLLLDNPPSDDGFPSVQQRKFVYRDRILHKYEYLYPSAADRNTNLEKVDPVCLECIKSLSNRKQPTFSPESGFNLGCSVPPELRGMIFAEEALISVIQPAMACSTLKKGARTFTGHVIFNDRTSFILDVASRLPRLAKDVYLVRFERQGTATKYWHFNVRRDKFLRALMWLVDNSPGYADITIDMRNINLLPLDGQLEANIVNNSAEMEEFHADAPGRATGEGAEPPIIQESILTTAGSCTVCNNIYV